jgi:bacterioferritin-associated ferredoxin
MMESTAFFNAKALLPEVGLFLDIDPKRDTIKEFHFDGTRASHFTVEMQELKNLTLGKSLEEVNKITRDQIALETKLPNGKTPIMPVGLWLLKKAIASYAGEGRYYKEQHDMVCLCFSVSKSDIVKLVLANKDFELKTLIQETMASSACGSCRMPIEKLIIDTRNAHGLIKGLDHSKARKDAQGNWIKVAGMYPGPLLVKLDELKREWMEREKITGQFEIEFTSIEGLHLTISINSTNEKQVAGLLSALTDFLKSKLGVLFFLKSVV